MVSFHILGSNATKQDVFERPPKPGSSLSHQGQPERSTESDRCSPCFHDLNTNIKGLSCLSENSSLSVEVDETKANQPPVMTATAAQADASGVCSPRQDQSRLLSNGRTSLVIKVARPAKASQSRRLSNELRTSLVAAKRHQP